MPPMDRRARPSRRCGQTLLEAVIVMPVFLLAVFLLLQIGHLGIGVAVVNYAAGSVARLAVQQNLTQEGTLGGVARDKFDKLLTARVKPVGLFSHVQREGGSDVTTDITVTACAELPAYPFVGPVLSGMLRGGLAADCRSGGRWLGPVSLAGPAPYRFLIRGQATARMNYEPRG